MRKAPRQTSAPCACQLINDNPHVIVRVIDE